jgi:hypothetical protein
MLIWAFSTVPLFLIFQSPFYILGYLYGDFSGTFFRVMNIAGASKKGIFKNEAQV